MGWNGDAYINNMQKKNGIQERAVFSKRAHIGMRALNRFIDDDILLLLLKCARNFIFT